MDRASILRDAIDYLKELLQRINDIHNEIEVTPPGTLMNLTKGRTPPTPPTPPTLQLSLITLRKNSAQESTCQVVVDVDGLKEGVSPVKRLRGGTDPDDVDRLKEGGSPVKRDRGVSDPSLVAEVKKVAEMVLVLAAMGKMKGGNGPTDVEKELMMGARDRLAKICGGFAPNDVFPVDAFWGLIEDLGLNKSKGQIRSPKVSIVERILVSKRKFCLFSS